MAAKPVNRRIKTPTIIQMEAVECGAASLGIVLGYFGRFIPLEELRVMCGVSRDGSKASNMCKAARNLGLSAKGYRKEVEDLLTMRLPIIVFWNFNHFLVVEGFKGDKVYLNDPKTGPRVISKDEFDLSFTGIAIEFELTPDFKKGGKKASFIGPLKRRLEGSGQGLLFVLLASLGLIIPGLLVPTFSRIFVDDILVRGREWIVPLLIAMGVTAVVRAGLTWLQQYYLLRMETKLALSSSSQFFWHILRLPIQFFHQRMSGEIATRVEINDRVAKLLSGELATTLLSIILVAFYAILMFQYDIILTLISISIVALNVVALRYFARKRRDANQKLLQEQGKLIGTAMNGLTIIETLKATGAESDFFARWAGYHAKTINAEQNLGLSSQLLSAIPPFLTSLNTTVVLAFGAYQVMNGNMTLGMLVAFQALMLNFLNPVNDLVTLGSRLQEVEGDMNKLDDVLRHRRDDYVEQAKLPEDIAEVQLAGYLELKNVTFGYNKLDKPLIENLSLSLRPGMRVALVGSSGSGKSTVAKLVAGLYEPWSGEILFDGKRRDEIPRHILNNSLAMVDQDIFMFEGNIRENLTLWDDTIPQTSVIQAAKDAHIHNDIVTRAGSYNHPVEEAGRNFSGGQRQRMEIARALVQNPTLLVLDEATSALDPVTEKIIDNNLRMRGCTCVIIAHRLSTIRDSDEIIMLEYGKVVQRGTHDELYQPGTPYYNMIAAETGETKKTQRDSIFDKLL